ncbi:hypothetical protein Tco_0989727 [Tanacetum coccineum]|uniref:Uncharacterized protein n=1 Tax=Tanacetum coccineum TaxID=301880 RepID=A0ABQ5EUF8_9ASTR
MCATVSLSRSLLENGWDLITAFKAMVELISSSTSFVVGLNSSFPLSVAGFITDSDLVISDACFAGRLVVGGLASFEVVLETCFLG